MSRNSNIYSGPRKTCHLIFNITPYCMVNSYTLCITGNKNEHYNRGTNFMHSQWHQLWHWYLQFGMIVGFVADDFLQCVKSNWLCASFAGSRPMFVFQFLLGYSLTTSLRAKNLLDSCRFLSKFYLQNSAYSHIPFHCLIITHHVIQWSERWSVTQLWRHQSTK